MAGFLIVFILSSEVAAHGSGDDCYASSSIIIIINSKLIEKVISLYGASHYCLFPDRIVTWVWSLAKGQYVVSWLLTGAPEQRYWQNMETANVGLDSSVGRAPACQSGSPALVNFSLFIQIYLKMYPVSFPCGLLHDIINSDNLHLGVYTTWWYAVVSYFYLYGRTSHLSASLGSKIDASTYTRGRGDKWNTIWKV